MVCCTTMGLTLLCFVVSSFLLVPAHSYLPIKDVECPGGGSCPDGNTCCPPAGCCPILNAVCCSDTLTCCPPGTSCGPNNRCYGSAGYTQPLSRISAQVKSKNDTKVRNIVCPDQGVCTDQQTCCAAGNGDFGCCPEPHATCCSDKKHCCPQGTVCDDGVCYKGDSKSKEPTPILANPKMDKAQNVICPDNTGSCPDGNTCCPTSSGGYGCCPSPGASCCSDGRHCCQNGYECSGSQCFPSGSLHPMMTLI